MGENDKKNDLIKSENSKSSTISNELVTVPPPPKFSFKPKNLTCQDSNPKSKSSQSQLKKYDKKRTSSSSHSSPKSKKSSKSRNSIVYQPPDYLKLNSVLGPRLTHFPLELTREYSVYLDNNGNPKYHEFNGTYAYNLPNYRREGGGKVLGLDGSYRISQSKSKQSDKLIGVKSQRSSEFTRYMDVKHSGLDYTFLLNKFNQSNDENNFDDSDFIKFGEWSQEIDYHSQQDQETELESVKDRYIREKIKEMEIYLADNPNDIQFWLNYIDFQQDHYQEIQGSKPSRRALAEIKVSMLEKALQHNLKSIELLQVYLTTCEEFMDPSQIQNKWTATLEDHPQAYQLWVDYVNFLESNFTLFSVTKLIEVYQKGISTLSQLKTQHSIEDQKDIEITQIQLFYRVCKFLKTAGFSNQAIAIFQAIIELNWFTPIPLENQPLYIKLNHLEEFWDKEWPRFGEDNGTGWSSYYGMNGEPFYDSTHPFHPQESIEQNDFNHWCELEMEAEIEHFFPIKSSQLNDEDEDIYKVILFEDVKGFLFPINNLSHKKLLIYLFLEFLGIPCNQQFSSNFNFNNDSHYTLDFMNSKLFYDKLFPSNSHNEIDIKDILNTFDRLNNNEESCQFNTNAIYPYNTTTPFCTLNWFQNFPIFNSFDKDLLINVPIPFIRNCLTRMKSIINDDFLLLLELRIETYANPGDWNSISKKLLKPNPNDLNLWSGYACLLWKHDELEKARDIFRKALQLYWTQPKDFSQPISVLYFTWINLEISHDLWDHVSDILISFVKYQVPRKFDSSIKSYITKDSFDSMDQFFYTSIQQAISCEENSPSRKSLIHLIHMHSITHYLFYSFNIYKLTELYDKWLFTLNQNGKSYELEIELLYMHYLYILYNYSHCGGAYKSSIVTQKWIQATEQFPNNIGFWMGLMESESKFKLANRLRNQLNTVLSRKPSIYLRLFSIYSQLQLHFPYNYNTVQYQFEQCIESKESKIHPLIWICYILFELKNNNMKHAKELIYKSIKFCPWSKDLYLFCIQYFPNIDNNNDQLIQDKLSIKKMMDQKGLRIRLPSD